VKVQAQEIYEKYFKAAQAQPRGVVAKLGNIVAQIERACQKQVREYTLHDFYVGNCLPAIKEYTAMVEKLFSDYCKDYWNFKGE